MPKKKQSRGRKAGATLDISRSLTHFFNASSTVVSSRSGELEPIPADAHVDEATLDEHEITEELEKVGEDTLERSGELEPIPADAHVDEATLDEHEITEELEKV
ncbi:hypothetical protein Tcan_06660 [Toxocara canis]|uniref:Uncharacterized protein n=1 Tax=Toxocara canis TaxID=6265 RepID=A0A0B2V6Y8_TOXCA|nr:hypothetical protein Tcan_06660 [Toxocara canis]